MRQPIHDGRWRWPLVGWGLVALLLLSSHAATVRGALLAAPSLRPTPSASNLVVPLLQRPFAGDFPVLNYFDHQVPLEFVDTNGLFINTWGESIQGIDGHDGYDWSMAEGTPLWAAAEGQVMFAGQEAAIFCPPLGQTTTGISVSLEHHLSVAGQEVVIRSDYAHLSRVDVSVGMVIPAGTQLGLSGNTGCSSQPHLHFGVRRLAPSTQNLVPIDPYGWEGSGPDPWAQDARGAQSLWLWKDQEAPTLFEEITYDLTSSTLGAQIGITTWRWMGWRDDLTPNAEFVELTTDPRFTPGAGLDLTDWSLRNAAGDRFGFPSGFTLAPGAAVRVYSGSGAPSATELYWGRSQGAWNNRGDCAQLVAPSGDAYFLLVTSAEPCPPPLTYTPTTTPALTASPTTTVTHTPTPTLTTTLTSTSTATPSLTTSPALSATPTSTPTPTLTGMVTVTPTANGSVFSSLVGQVRYQGRGAAPSDLWLQQVEVRFYLPGGNVPEKVTQTTTDQNGSFTVTGVPAVTYDVWIKPAQALARRVNSVSFLAGSPVGVSFGLLPTGDSDNNNVIDIVDFSLLRAAFGSSQTCGTAIPNPVPCADYDGSGQIDIVDFSLLRSNFGQSGPS